MPARFDPYHTWLGIPPAEQPPHHYRLLGAPCFETEMSVIGHAADRQIAYVKTFLDGPHSGEAEQVLEQLRAARLCLFDSSRKARYDAELRRTLASAPQAPAGSTSTPESGAAAVARPAPRASASSRASAVLPPQVSAPPPVPPPALPPAAAVPMGMPVITKAIEPAEEVASDEIGLATKLRKRQGVRPEILLIAGGGMALLIAILALGYSLTRPGERAFQTDHDKQTRETVQRADGAGKNAEHDSNTDENATIAVPTLPNDASWSDDDDDDHPLDKKGRPRARKKPARPANPPKKAVAESKPVEAEQPTIDSTLPAAATSEPPPQQPPPPPRAAVELAERLSVPKLDQQTAAASELKNLYKDEFARAKAPAEKLDLSEKLIQIGADATAALPTRYTALREAYDQALAAGGYAQALQALAALAEFESADVNERQPQLLIRISSNLRTNEQRWELAGEALSLVSVLLSQRRFDDAERMANLADQLGQRVVDARLRKLASSANAEVRIARREFHAFEQARQTLETTPNDPAANTALGKYLCQVEADFESGLPKLAQGSDEKLKALAVRDISSPADATEQTKLADEWYDLAAGDKPAGAFLARAAAWYRRAALSVGGAYKPHVEKRLGELLANGEVALLLEKPGVIRLGPPLAEAELAATERNTLPGHGKGTRFVLFSPDHKTLISAGADKSIKLWDIAAGAERQELTGHREEVTCVAVSADGTALASSSLGGAIGLWTLRPTARQVGTLHGASPKIACVAASRDGKVLVSLGLDGKVSLWDAPRNRELRSYQAHEKGGHWLAMAPDGRRFATCGADRSIKVWNAAGRWEYTLNPSDTPNVVAYAPGGKSLAFGGEGKMIEIWSTESPAQVGSLAGHERPVVSLAFSRDGFLLASADESGVVRLWDVAAGKEMIALPARKDRLNSLDISPDGSLLAAGCESGQIVLFDLSLQKGKAPTQTPDDLDLPRVGQ